MEKPLTCDGRCEIVSDHDGPRPQQEHDAEAPDGSSSLNPWPGSQGRWAVGDCFKIGGSAMTDGWVKLHREIKKKAIWQCTRPEHKVVLIALLTMVNHEPRQWVWNGEKHECQPGQVVTSLKSLADECGPGVSIQNVRSALMVLERKFDFLTNVSTKTGRLITIKNWARYQCTENMTNSVTNKEVTKSQQRGNKELTPIKEVKKLRIKELNPLFDKFWNAYPKKKKKGDAEKAWKKIRPSEELLQQMLSAIEQQKKSHDWTKQDGQYIPYPATWLNSKQWLDEDKVDISLDAAQSGRRPGR